MQGDRKKLLPVGVRAHVVGGEGKLKGVEMGRLQMKQEENTAS